jgi:rod shape determining protein RodA
MHRFSVNRLSLPILVPAIFIAILALLAFYMIDPQIFRQQFFFLFLALFAYFVFLNIDYKIFGYYSKQIYIVMIISLLTLFVIGIEARGAVRWIEILGLRLQFSEVFKPFFIIFLASYLTKNDSRNLGKFVNSFLLLAPVFILTLVQPDLGNAMVYLLTTVLMLFAYGFPWSYFIGSGALVAIPAPILFNFLHDYQKERLLTFVDPTRDPFGSSYNAVQSLISIGSGGWFGKGFGQATQSLLEFLPERHTDFIFATISESTGFIGALLLVGSYIFLLYKIHSASRATDDDFANLIILGFYFILLVQVFLNIGMNLGVVPIVGITLPFASYGGSSLLTSFIILGIISSMKFDFKKNKSLEIT